MLYLGLTMVRKKSKKGGSFKKVTKLQAEKTKVARKEKNEIISIPQVIMEKNEATKESIEQGSEHEAELVGQEIKHEIEVIEQGIELKEKEVKNNGLEDLVQKIEQKNSKQEELTQKIEQENNRKKEKQPTKTKWPLWAKILTGFAIFVTVILVAGGIFIYSLLSRTTKIFKGNPMDLIIGTDLKKDIHGRSNILVFGTSEDEEGHGGAMLTDSIIVLSVDQEKKNARMFSVPRDLWVEYGLNCSKGFAGKINAVYECAMEGVGGDSGRAAEYFAEKVGRITGVTIQYYLAVDWTVVRDVVNTLGGIDVDIYTDSSLGINDFAMGLKLPAGVNHLDGVNALKLARARNAMGGYGLSRSNFDREINQQRILNAVKAKASELGFLANPGKILEMVDALGDNIKTNITVGEIRRAVETAAKMKTWVESVDTSSLYTTGYIGPASVVLPSGAVESNPYHYGGIQEFIYNNVLSTREK